jgi:CheY-like chemotaxis protein
VSAGNVLIVDDDPFIRKLIATTLRDVGDLELHQAGDGEEALALAASHPPVLVFLDVEMPRLDGIGAAPGACHRVRADQPSGGSHLPRAPLELRRVLHQRARVVVDPA